MDPVGMRIVYYLHQVGFVFVGVSQFVCEFVRLQAGLRKIYWTDFHEIRWKDVTWAMDEPVRVWW